jgi:hypothetical protein
MIDRILVTLLAGSAVFGGLCVAELGSPDGRLSTPSTRPISATEAPPVKQQKFPAASELIAASLERPLFSPSRRPAARVDGSRVDGSDVAKLRVAGIVINTDHRFAIFAAQGRKPFIRTEGETVSEWYIDRITPEQVFLSGPNGMTTLEMKADPTLARPTLARPALTAKSRPDMASTVKPPTGSVAPIQVSRPTTVTSQSRENVPRGGAAPTASQQAKPVSGSGSGSGAGSGPARRTTAPTPHP